MNAEKRWSNGKEKGGFVLMGTIVLLLFISILLTAALMRSDMEHSNARLNISSEQAFYAAESGLETAIFNLRSNPNWQDTVADVNVPLTLNTDVVGYYTVRIADQSQILNGQNVYWVRSTGQGPLMNDPGAQQTPRAIEAQVWVQNPAAFLFLTLGDLWIKDGSVINNNILGRDIRFVIQDTDPIQINGQISYLRRLLLGAYGNTTFVTHPQVNSGGSVPSSPIGSITFPGIDVTQYQAYAQSGVGNNTGLVLSGNNTITLSGDRVNLNGSNLPQENIQIIYVNGNLHISGTYAHSMMIVANGNVRITNNITPQVSDPTLPVPQIGIMAKQDLVIPSSAPNNLTVEAFLLADGGGTTNGRLRAEGAHDSKGTFSFNGSIAVRGRGSNITPVDLAVFRQRNYTYNQALANALSIPYMTYIANVVPGTWQEVRPWNAPPPTGVTY